MWTTCSSWTCKSTFSKLSWWTILWWLSRWRVSKIYWRENREYDIDYFSGDDYHDGHGNGRDDDRKWDFHFFYFFVDDDFFYLGVHVVVHVTGNILFLIMAIRLCFFFHFLVVHDLVAVAENVQRRSMSRILFLV
jgi:hypothetical protein